MLKSVGQIAEEAKKLVPEIQAAEIAGDLTKGTPPYVLVDVREGEEQAAGMIPHAVPLPRGVIELSIAKVAPDENTPIVCYCGGGTRSLLAGEQLKRMGYTNVKSMAGGFKAWKMGGHPIA